MWIDDNNRSQIESRIIIGALIFVAAAAFLMWAVFA